MKLPGLMLKSSAIVLCVGLSLACGGTETVENDPVFDEPIDDIYAAAEAGDVESVKRIILEGNWDYGSADGKGKFPLEYAVEKGNPEIVLMMLQGGADPNIRNSEGQSMLQVARDRGHKEAEQLLIQGGARE
jgi:ankyrin repeat protein